jgi:hypothetical protein
MVDDDVDHLSDLGHVVDFTDGEDGADVAGARMVAPALAGFEADVVIIALAVVAWACFFRRGEVLRKCGGEGEDWQGEDHAGLLLTYIDSGLGWMVNEDG